MFIWDQDVVSIIRKGLEKGASGIYNLAGDGALSLREIAEILRKPYRPLPAGLIRGRVACAQATAPVAVRPGAGSISCVTARCWPTAD